jgi:hypothetical protein
MKRSSQGRVLFLLTRQPDSVEARLLVTHRIPVDGLVAADRFARPLDTPAIYLFVRGRRAMAQLGYNRTGTSPIYMAVAGGAASEPHTGP